LGIHDIQIYEFDFEYEGVITSTIGARPNRIDPRISATIIDLLEQFFHNKLGVIVYICSSLDGKHNGRHVLFEDWYNRNPAGYKRIPIDIDVDLGDGEILTIYGCALMRNDFPHLHILEKDLINEAAGIITQKF